MRTTYTIGHSNQPLEAFISLLEEFRVAVLADVRHVPGSRRHPWFAKEALRQAVEARGLEYRWFQALGGFRGKPKPDSPHTGLRHPGFRSYADYMLTLEFRAAVEELMRLAKEKTTAYMCAEAMYWHCHRMLLSDYLTAQGWQVVHILGHGKARPHQLTREAMIAGGQLTYPAAAGELFG